MAFLWGVTNPFIKKGAKGLENVKSSSKFGQFFKELAFLVTNLKVSFKIFIILNKYILLFTNKLFFFFLVHYTIYH